MEEEKHKPNVTARDRMSPRPATGPRDPDTADHDPMIGTQRRTDSASEAHDTPDEQVIETRLPQGEAVKSRKVAAALGIFLGGLGVHRFYLGYNKVGLFQLALTVLSAGLVLLVAPVIGLQWEGAVNVALGVVAVVWVWAFGEAVLIAMGTLHLDAAGRPLKP